MPKSEHIHLIAICGTGMAALAGLLKKAGHQVCGSDQSIYPPMSTLLEWDGIVCHEGYQAEHINLQTTSVIIGNAVSKDNPEVLEALRRKLPVLSMSAALDAFFLREKQSLVVSGTHGKTTTASLLTWVLTSAGQDPGALIGGWMKNFDSNHRLGKGDAFVVEGDEYDTSFFDKGPKFLHYRPEHAILTSIEFDHADIFQDISAIKTAFRKFVQLIPAQGFLLAASESPEIDSVIAGLPCRVERYGIEKDTGKISLDWKANEIRQKEALMTFQVFYRKKLLGQISSPLIGYHNLNNALAVIALTHHLGLSWEAIQAGIQSFQGIKRRQETVGSVKDILVIDDFAHHPTAVSETLAALKMRYPGRRLWAVFEPRSATSRRNIFQDAFAKAFQGADQVVLAGLYLPEKVPEALRSSPEEMVQDLRGFGVAAYFIPTVDQIVSELIQELVPGDVVCIMSCGGFDGIHQKLLKQLKRRFLAS